MSTTIDIKENVWLAIEIKELKDLHAKKTPINVISQKLRRQKKEITDKIQELGLDTTEVSPNGTHTVILPIPGWKQPSTESLPDVGELLTKIKNDTALQHQDIILLESKITARLDGMAVAINKIARIQEEMLQLNKEWILIIKEQHEAWKQKNKRGD